MLVKVPRTIPTAAGSVISTANQWLAEGDPVFGLYRMIHTSGAVAVDLSAVVHRVVCVPTTRSQAVL